MAHRRRYTEEELREFETRWNIVLPKLYRTFLKIVGCTGTAGLMRLDEWQSPHDPEDFESDFLSTQFPHRLAWNDRSLKRSDSGFGSPYHSDDLWRGSLRIRNTGCEGYDILVVSGPCAGEVWHDDRICSGGGIFPLGISLSLYLSLAAFGIRKQLNQSATANALDLT